MIHPIRVPAASLLLLVAAASAQAQLPIRPLSRAAREGTSLLDRPARLNVTNVTLEDALLELTRSSGVHLAFSPARLPVDVRANCLCHGITVREALDHLLAGTALEYSELAGQIVLFPALEPVPAVRRLGYGVRDVFASTLVGATERPARPVQERVVAGVVVSAATGRPLEGVQVVAEGLNRGAVSDAMGRFRIEGLPQGREVSLRVAMIGYRTALHAVRVGDLSVRLALEESAVELEDLVVTGTAFATRARTVPNPISVITAREIEAKRPGSITDLLRGEIPGVMALTWGQDDFNSGIYVRGNAGWSTGDLIKIYIDGVEVASPNYVSTIDPRMIERIEVVRGPQAAVIYGSEAASGVLQIFTKKGGSEGEDRPIVEVLASAGVIESKYTPPGVTPLTQDHGIEVRGGSDAFSYRAGGSYVSVGEWLKNYGSRTVSLSGGFRAVQGPLTAELTTLWSERDLDYANSPIFARWPASPACSFCGDPDVRYPNWEYRLSQNTVGLTLRYAAGPNWQHSLTLGDDQNRYGYHQPAAHRLTPADTFVRLVNTELRRRSVRYNTAYEVELTGALRGRLTAGADYWSYDVQGSTGSNLLSAFGTVRTSSRTSASFQNDRWWNAGYFAMGELGFRDRLYLTLATRVEENPNLGEEYGAMVSPRVGAAYVTELGPLELKLRGQFGKGVRPPPAYARAGQVFSSQTYLPNPKIGPEEKVGWDAGIEIYRGRSASFGLTRYVEEGRNLIQGVAIDISSTPQIRQYQNIGRVASEGWELEGSLRMGRVSLKANYAYADNVIRELSDQYTSSPNSTYQVGDRMVHVPKHSGGGTLTAQVWRGNASLSMSIIDEWRAVDDVAYYGFEYGGEPFRGSFRDYFITYSDALVRWHLRAEQEVRDGLTAFLRVDNLTNNQAADFENYYVARGRTVVLGARWVH